MLAQLQQPTIAPYLLLKPVKTTSQYASWHHGLLVTPKDIEQSSLSELLPGIEKANHIALDFETNGTFLPDQQIKPVGIGLCWRVNGNLVARYITFKLPVEDKIAPIKLRRKLYKYLANLPAKLIAHNLMFDGTLFTKELGSWPDNLYWDTLALTRHLATEGWIGQSYSLKALMQELLGWPESNEQELDDWLEKAYPGTKKDYRKGMMYTAPDHILGRYCLQDVEATLLLFDRVLQPALEKLAGPSYVDHYYPVFLRHLKRISESYMTGIKIDKNRLATYYCKLKMQLDDVYSTWRALPKVAAGIKTYNQQQVEEILKTEPARLTKDNDVSKNWLAWYDRLTVARNTDHFSETSSVQLRWLFFEYLKKKPFKLTDKGTPSTDEDSLNHLGEEGKKLAEAKAFEKMVTAFLWPHLDRHIKSHGKDSEGNPIYRVHPSYKVPGTYTGRLGGSTPNYQQLPKDAEFLSCLVPSPGNVFLDADVNALEQVVMTELTRDETLWKLYGPDAKANDVYLFVGSQLPVIGPDIRKYYDPNNPTPESIAAAKKNCKKLRSIAKVVVLSSSYGAGAKKIHSTLTMQGIDVDLEQVQAIHAAYWKLFSGIKTYQNKLTQEWRDRRGWIRNGIGRPLAVDERRLKDLVNTTCQSTGHDCLIFYVDFLAKRLEAAGINYSWVVVDYHDETIIEVAEAQAEKAKDCMVKAFDDLNEFLQGDILLSGEPCIAYDFKPFKLD